MQLDQPDLKRFSGAEMLGAIVGPKRTSVEMGRERIHVLYCSFFSAGFGLERLAATAIPNVLVLQSTDMQAPALMGHLEQITLTASSCLSFPICKTEIMKVTFLRKLWARSAKC